MKWPPSRRALVIALILIAALAIRIGEVQRTSYKPINDATAYLELAGQIAHTGSYPTSPARGAGAAGSGGPSAYFPPGFPYFLAAVEEIDGDTTAGAKAVHPARLSQAVLGAAVVGLIGLVALEALGSMLALIALALAAIYPVLIELSGTLVAENLLTALVVAALWAMLRARRSERPYRWVAAAGALTGLATLSHLNGIVLLPPLAFAAWRVRRGVAAPALVVAVALLTLAPWTIRNAIVLHRLIPVSDETGITLVGTYNPTSAADSRVPYKWRLYNVIPGERRLTLATPHLSELKLNDRLLSHALHYIGDHPFSPFAVAYYNARRLFALDGSFAWHASAAAIGLDRGYRQDRRDQLLDRVRAGAPRSVHQGGARSAAVAVVGWSAAVAERGPGERRDAPVPRAGRAVPDPARRLRTYRSDQTSASSHAIQRSPRSRGSDRPD